MNFRKQFKTQRIAQWILASVFRKADRLHRLGDFEEVFQGIAEEEGYFTARRWYWWQVLKSLPPLMKNLTYWGGAMFKHYLKVALRHMKRDKAYSFINLTGLTLGLTGCVLTVIWAQYEYSFDRFHRNAESIYRVVSEDPSSIYHDPVFGAPPPLGPALAAEYPEVTHYSRFMSLFLRGQIRSGRILDAGIRVGFIDPHFIHMFDFPFIEGDPKTALQNPDAVLLTQSAAKRFFGDENPHGKSLLFYDEKIPMKVTGILEDVPENSHIQFDLVVPIGILERIWNVSMWEDWTNVRCDLYLQLTGPASAQDFEPKIQECIMRNDPRSVLKASLQPLKDIHFQPDFEFAWWRCPEKKWIIGQINLFLFISLMVLVVSCINGINLATARSLIRIKEIGIRKVNGASRPDIVRQSLIESMLLSFLALAAAVVLAYFLLPFLRELTDRRLDLHLLDKGYLGLLILCLTLATGFLSGFYPALFVSSYNPVKAIKNAWGKGRLSLLLPRRILVSVQFLCSTVLIMVTSVLLLQLDFLSKKDLGYRKENLVVISGISAENADAFKNVLLKNSRILSVTCSEIPAMSAKGHLFDPASFHWEGKSPDDRTSMDLIGTDEDFPKTYGIPMTEGRFFSKEFPDDVNNIVVNESAVRAMGLEDPIGKIFEVKRGRKVKGQIIGVIKDYHTSSLRAKIRPTVIEYFKGGISGMTSIRISENDVGQTLRDIESTFRQVEPEGVFSFTFLEDRLSSLYIDDHKVSRVITYYGLQSLAIAGLGLIGLVALVAERRTKEIGIRKVLGASVSSIVHLVSREFLIIVGLASFLAWPVGFFFASNWLKEFAYRISLSVWIFAGALFSVMVFAFATVAWQSWKAARLNPVISLRYE